MNPNNNQNKKKPQGGGQQQQQQQQQQQNKQQNTSTSKLQIQQQPLLSPSQNQMKERSMFIYLNLVGYVVSVTVKNGVIYEGVLHSVNSSTSGGGIGVVLKMARKKEHGTITTQPTPTILIESKDFVSLTAPGVVLDHQQHIGGNGSPHSLKPGQEHLFNTDTDISGFDGNLKERELQPWSGDTHHEESLEGDSSHGNGSSLGSSAGSGSDKKWDQFATNEKLFGVKTTFDEGLYTTPLDKASDFYKSNIHLAEKKANEIENDKSSTSNLHLLEERGHVQGSDYDEEERYSSVVRKDTPQTSKVPVIPINSDKYVPPRQRLLQQQQQSSQSPNSTPTKEHSPPVINKLNITPNKDNAAAATTSSPTTPLSKDKDSSSNEPSTPTSGATSIKDNSPNVSKLILNRDLKQPEEDHGVLGSPRDGLSPRFVEYMKVRQGLSDSKTKLVGSDTPKSPLIQNRELLSSLSLEVVSGVPPEVVNDFNNFKLGKMNPPDRQSQMETLKTFQRDYNIKSKSRPSSPLVSSPRIAPSPTHFSLSGSSKENDQKSTPEQQTPTTKEKENDQKSTTDTTTTTTTTPTTETKKEDNTKEEAKKEDTTKSTSTTSLSKFKLNPNAKSFTPTSTPTNLSTSSLSKFKTSGDHELNKSAGGVSLTDTRTPINDVYYEYMKKRQNVLEPSDSVSQYWVDPYRQYEDDQAAAAAAYYNQMSRGPPTMVSMPINAMPFYPGQIPVGKGGQPILTGKPIQYSQNPPRSYSGGPPPPGPHNPYAVAYVPQPQPPHFQYVPQPMPVFNNQMPPPHQMGGPKRYYQPQPIPNYSQQPPPPNVQQPQQPGSSPNRILTSPNYPPPPYGMQTRYQPHHDASSPPIQHVYPHSNF